MATTRAGLSLAFDDGAAGPALRFGIAYTPEALGLSLPTNLNLLAMNTTLPQGLDALGALVDIGGTDPLAVDAFATIQLDLGIDLANPGSPQAFLYDTSNATYSFSARNADLNFSALAGALATNVTAGQLAYDVDGAGPRRRLRSLP